MKNITMLLQNIELTIRMIQVLNIILIGTMLKFYIKKQIISKE